MNTYNWIELLLVPITSIVTWGATRGKRRNDALKDMQETMDMLVSKNAELCEEIVKLRQENAELKAEIMAMKAEINRRSDEAEA